MTDPTAHWSPSEVDDPDDDRASYPPPAPGIRATTFTARAARTYLALRALREAQRECSQCGAVDPPTTDADAMGGERVTVHDECPARDGIVLPTLHERSIPLLGADECRDACEAVIALTEQLTATEAEARTALDALHKRCDAAEAEVGRLRAELDGPAPDADRSRLAPKSPRVVFLYRPKELDRGEHEAAARHFVMAESRLDVRAGDVVIARHFAWPWPRELFDDLRRVGARPVNDARGHAYAADLLAWTDDLGDLCPAATDRFETLPERGPFIVKGEKADKGRWSRMFAETKADAIRLRSELMADSGMRNATIVARQYVVLAPLGDAPVPGACPPSVEFRVFVAFGRVLSAGYYWPPEDCNAALLAASPRPEDIPADFLAEAVARVSPRVDFFTLDVGVDCDGRWWVIEVSDGLRAGMSENDPAAVYAGLAAAIVAHYGDTTRPAAAPDRDLCPTCGALDLDHSPEECARRWAEAHPYAAGAMHGGIAHRSEVTK